MSLDKDLKMLGVRPSASPDEIKAAFRSLAQICHPDLGGDALRFAELRQAYERVLAHAHRPKRCPRCLGICRVVMPGSAFSAATCECPECGGRGMIVQ